MTSNGRSARRCAVAHDDTFQRVVLDPIPINQIHGISRVVCPAVNGLVMTQADDSVWRPIRRPLEILQTRLERAARSVQHAQ